MTLYGSNLEGLAGRRRTGVMYQLFLLVVDGTFIKFRGEVSTPKRATGDADRVRRNMGKNRRLPGGDNAQRLTTPVPASLTSVMPPRHIRIRPRTCTPACAGFVYIERMAEPKFRGLTPPAKKWSVVQIHSRATAVEKDVILREAFTWFSEGDNGETLR